ncbi:MAG: polysaccharide export protein [Candidatus Nanopelagicales bacterium]|jgi:polysaccharide export outer membrane protein|nr:polysaccharide export protein [Candidatus Nanopelagicales bacterium]
MKGDSAFRFVARGLAAVAALGLAGCQAPAPVDPAFLEFDPTTWEYVVGAGDSVNIFVWRNPEVSQTVSVRPDGRITTPLVEDVIATGKTPTQLAREMEQILSQYIKEPLVTVMMGGGAGPYDQQIRVLGEATNPQALSYRFGMTLLDLMIAVGGISDFAAGNRAVLVRAIDGKVMQTTVRLDDLIRDADISANVPMRPGDILIIPESWF